MIANSFFTQVVMTILAVGILFFYVNPTFTNIGVIQDSIMQYQTEKGKVNEVNAQLASLKQRLNNISASDTKALMTYLPEKVDQMAVSRDLLSIAEESNVYLQSVRYDKSTPAGATNNKDKNLLKHTFSLSLVGSYEDVKVMLGKLEQNNYPLEVHKLGLNADEEGVITAAVSVITYSYTNTI